MDCVLNTILRRVKLKKEINYELASRYLRRYHKISLDREVYDRRMKEILK